jgi:hypothetical protein
MNDFKVLVERVVRPVQAGPARALRMRDELLAHLNGVYEQELARSGNEAEARAEAMRRLGDPAVLTRELESSLTWRDRIEARVDRWFGWRPGDTPWRFGQRCVLLIAVILLPILVPFILSGELRHPVDPTVPTTATFLRIWVAMMVFGGAQAFAMGAMIVAARKALYGEPHTRSRARVMGYALLLAMLTQLLGIGLMITAVADWSESMSLVVPHSAGELLVNVISLLVFPAAVILFARASAEVAARRLEWARLDIGS